MGGVDVLRPQAANSREDRRRETLNRMRVDDVRAERRERRVRCAMDPRKPLVPRVPNGLAGWMRRMCELGQPGEMNRLDSVEGRSPPGEHDDLVPLTEGLGQLGDVRFRSAAAFGRKHVRDEGDAHFDS